MHRIPTWPLREGKFRSKALHVAKHPCSAREAEACPNQEEPGEGISLMPKATIEYVHVPETRASIVQ